MKNWIIRKFDTFLEPYLPYVSEALNLSLDFTRLLLSRINRQYPHLFEEEFETKNKEEKEKILQQIDFFLNPSLKKLLHPSFLPDVEKASAMLVKNLQKGEPVLIWGDYDVDGITAASLCAEVLREHGYEVLVHLPLREEGYGLNQEVLAHFIEKKGIKLLITVDCGISDYDIVEFARTKGIEVIITDHHLPPEQLPNAHSIINPCLCKENSDYVLKDVALAGVGVAFFLMCQVNNDLSKVPHPVHKTQTKCDMRTFLDLVALGTVADMVPLRGLNRILVKNGLVKLKECTRVGLKALKEVAGYTQTAFLTAGQIAFGLAPRINAAGRMADPHLALQLLRSQDYREALHISEQLNLWNKERKKEEEEMVQEALVKAEFYLEDPALVIEQQTWNPGIIGIVASRLLERFYKLTIILTEEKKESDQQEIYYKGSGRSTNELDLHEALTACSEYLVSFGGHKKAAGLKILKENIPAFRQALNDFIRAKTDNKVYYPTIYIDGELNFVESSNSIFLKELTLLEPFGIGNPEPHFATSDIELRNIITFGYGGKHTKLDLYDTKSRQLLHAKLWNIQEFPYPISSRLSLAYNTEIDNYRGMQGLNLSIKDYKLASEEYASYEVSTQK